MNPTDCPEDDSPDLTDDEIANAVPTTGIDDLAKIFCTKFSACGCGSPFVIQKAVLRRRKSNLYSRMLAACTSDHKCQVTFVVNWLL
jgi:hypothetical protein